MNDQEITDVLRRLEQKLDEVHKILRSMPTPTVEYKQLTSDDADLDSKYGNPKVKFMAKNWKGQDVTGWSFSDCPPEYLDMHAHMLDYFAKKDAANPEKAKDAIWRARDAARARGWAERIRAQAASAAKSVSWDFGGDNVNDSDIPF